MTLSSCCDHSASSPDPLNSCLHSGVHTHSVTNRVDLSELTFSPLCRCESFVGFHHCCSSPSLLPACSHPASGCLLLLLPIFPVVPFRGGERERQLYSQLYLIKRVRCESPSPYVYPSLTQDRPGFFFPLITSIRLNLAKTADKSSSSFKSKRCKNADGLWTGSGKVLKGSSYISHDWQQLGY